MVDQRLGRELGLGELNGKRLLDWVAAETGIIGYRDYK